MSVHIRLLNENDTVIISKAFQEQGWGRSPEQYLHYLAEQQNGERVTLVAELNGEFAGYVNVLWNSSYPSFREQGIPEINDFNVLMKFQRQGIRFTVDGPSRGSYSGTNGCSRHWCRCVFRLWQSASPICPSRVHTRRSRCTQT